MKPNKNANGKNFTKPVTKTLPFVVTGHDFKGNTYDADSATTLVGELQEAGVFDKLSIMVTASRSLILGDESLKGAMKIAAIKSFDNKNGSMDLTFFGRNVEYVNATDNLVVVPRVRFDREGKVFKIIDFEVVAAMDA